MKFKCRKCGATQLEEVMTDVVQSSSIVGIEEDCGEVVYGNSSSDGGELARYQCMECGDIIKDKQGQTITDPKALIAWLRKNKML